MTDNPWTASTGDTVHIEEVGLYIDGEYLPDKEGTTND